MVTLPSSQLINNNCQPKHWLWAARVCSLRRLSGGGTCHRHKNRALGDTFLKFGVVLEQAMRSSKTTGYKLAHIRGGCSCKNRKRPTTDTKYTISRLLLIVSSSIIPILFYFLSMGNNCCNVSK